MVTKGKWKRYTVIVQGNAFFLTLNCLRTNLLHLTEAIPADGHQVATVMAGQGDGFVDAPAAKHLAALPTVILSGDLIERDRTGRAVWDTAQRLPVDGDRIDLIRHLGHVHVVLVVLGGSKIGKGKVGSLERMVVVRAGQLTQSLVVVVPVVVLLDATVVDVLVALEPLGRLGDHVLEAVDAPR